MRQLALLLSAFAIGCGIPDATLMSDLDDDQVEKLCGELASDIREVNCTGDGGEYGFELGGSQEECISDHDFYDGCDVTVGDVRECNEAWDALSDEEICSLEDGFPPECDPVIDCAVGG